MPVKELHDRVADGFARDETREFADKYLELVLTSWRDVQAAMRRTGVLLVLLMVVFLVLVKAERIDLSVVGIKVTNLSAALSVLPAVVSFLLAEFLLLGTTWAVYRDTFTAVVNKSYEDLSHNDLEVLMAPATTLIWGWSPSMVLRSEEPGAPDAILQKMSIFTGLVILLSPLLFFLYAYWELSTTTV